MDLSGLLLVCSSPFFTGEPTAGHNTTDVASLVLSREGREFGTKAEEHPPCSFEGPLVFHGRISKSEPPTLMLCFVFTKNVFVLK